MKQVFWYSFFSFVLPKLGRKPVQSDILETRYLPSSEPQDLRTTESGRKRNQCAFRITELTTARLTDRYFEYFGGEDWENKEILLRDQQPAWKR